jgi:enolase-phosphatase E1
MAARVRAGDAVSAASQATPAHVVLDIEGTTSPAAFVHGHLYPYATARFASWLVGHGTEEDMARAIKQVREQIGEPADGLPCHREAPGQHQVIAALEDWSRRDLKVSALKTIQGRIWAHGFAVGDLTAPFFPDVIPALRAWQAAGRRLYIYSSGSADAQRAWFGHTLEGDLCPLLSGYFDTENAGSKKAVASYDVIAATIGSVACEIVFLSDTAGELDAARAAGWRTIGVCRPGEPNFAAGTGDHHMISSFGELGIGAGDL